MGEIYLILAVIPEPQSVDRNRLRFLVVTNNTYINMKRISFILILASTSCMLRAQVNMYDITTHEDVYVNKNINQNIHVGGAIYENKTITTIDYGALAAANAEMQRLQFERQQYADEKQRRLAMEMAANPIKAYDYGYEKKGTTKFKGKEVDQSGFKCYTMSYIVPHPDFFYMSRNGTMENLSTDGNVRTEITMYTPTTGAWGFDMEASVHLTYQSYSLGVNDSAGLHPYYVYKKNLTKTNCFSNAGYKLTTIFEDEYQYCIIDLYQSYDATQNIVCSAVCRTYCSKDDANFEDLEGRRYYLKPLVEKVISTAMIYDVKLAKKKK